MELSTMDVRISKTDLLSTLQTCQQFLDRTSSPPGSRRLVELRVTPQSLTCRVQTAEAGYWRRCHCVPPWSSRNEEAIIIVDADSLLECVEVCDPSFVMRVGSGHPWLQLWPSNFGNESRKIDEHVIRIPVVDADEPDSKVLDWPQHVPVKGEPAELVFPSHCDGSLLATLSDCAMFASSDETRVNLRALCFEHDGSAATIAATDGHRMVVVHRSVQMPGFGPLLIPRKIADLLSFTWAGCTVKFDNDRIFFEATDGGAWAKLEKVTFPPYRQVIPPEFATAPRLQVDGDRLLEAIAVMIRAHTRGRGRTARMAAACMLVKNGKFWLATPEPIPVDAPHAQIALAFEGDTPSETPVGFNLVFAQEALKLIRGDVFIWWQGKEDPIFFSNHDRTEIVVIMPMRL